MRESLYSFFCGIRSRAVEPLAFEKFDYIEYQVLLKEEKGLFETFMFDDVKLPLKFPFSISLANTSCSCKSCPRFWGGNLTIYFGYNGKLVSKPSNIWHFPIRSFPTFSFELGRKGCIDAPKSLCKKLDGLFPVSGKVNSIEVHLSAFKVSFIFKGLANFKEINFPRSGDAYEDIYVWYIKNFSVMCSSTPKEVFIEYNDGFIEFLLEHYQASLKSNYSYILTFSQEKKVKNLLLKIKSLLGG